MPMSGVMTVCLTGQEDLENDPHIEETVKTWVSKWALELGAVMVGKIRGEVEYAIEIDDNGRVWEIRAKVLVVRETLDTPGD